MKSRLSYFIFNKRSDYERGSVENLEYNEHGISVDKDSPDGRGRFMSRVLDSYQGDMNWHRLCFKVEGSTAGAYRLIVYASNTLDFERDGELYRIDELARSPELDFDEKLDLLQPFVQKQAVGMRDIYIHDVVGRYLWIVFEMYSQDDEKTIISDITIFLPGGSWLEYLPAIYQKADMKSGFLERYLGIFQTLYEDMNAKIGRVADCFDANSTDSDFLQWMSEWLDIADSYIWSEEKLRLLLSLAVELYLERGTKRSVEDIVELYTGSKPFVVEAFQLDRFKGSEEYEKALLPMYGDNPLSFTVLVKEEHVRSVREYNILLKIIEEMKPVQMELRLVVIKPYIFLNRYSYLGINSVLGQYREISLNGSNEVEFTVINN